MAILPMIMGSGGGASKKTKTKLWTNPNPGSSSGFTSQTITLSDDIDNYDCIELEFAFNYSTLTNRTSVIYSVDEFKKYTSTWYGTTSVVTGGFFYSRSFVYSSDTSILFNSTFKWNASNSGSTANTATVPLNIYGIKYEGSTTEYTETSLWTNGSPTSAFAAQTVTLLKGLSNFKYLKIVWNTSTSDSQKGQMILPVDNFDTTYNVAPYIASYTSVTYLRSVIKSSDTEISIGQGLRLNNSGLDNTAVIPLEILGLNELDTGTITTKPVITVMYYSNYANYFLTVTPNGTFETSGFIGGTSPSKLSYENDYFKMQMNAASNHNGTITFKVSGTYYENLNNVPQTAVHKNAGNTWSGAMYTQSGSMFIPD